MQINKWCKSTSSAIGITGRRICTALVTLICTWSTGGQTAEAPIIAAASDLQFALTEIAQVFAADTGSTVKVSFGSSGNLARQIRQGAPFELFLSADESFVVDLFRDGFTRDEGELYALGRIVIFAPRGSPLQADGSLDDLQMAVTDGRVAKFAIANPEHAPYGQRAQEVLRRRGIWDAIVRKLVLGENVSQAAQFASSTNTQGGIIAYSLALSPRVSARGTYALIPDDWHAPLRQRMALIKGAGPLAERFYSFVQRDAVRLILRKYGFVLPRAAGLTEADVAR
ncbi:MAG: molybdate ABC transporter substrate-binding protein [Gammaproteobacteria bacterium]|nr:molybdate ABC transporter substrate-binding protein [Gammaproteobacteria bacterium]